MIKLPMFRTTALVLMLAITPAAVAQPNPEEGERFVRLMSQYLQLADQVVQIASHREAAVFLALEGVFEVYEQRRDAPGAVRHLERMLKDYGSDPTVRNLIRFKLRDIYKETGQADKALEQLDLIIKENATP